MAKLSICAWNVIKRYLKSCVVDNDAVPDASIAVQTYGDFLNFNPHLHAIVSDGCFSKDGAFHMTQNILTPEDGGIFQAAVLDEDAAAVRALYLKEGFSQVKVDKIIQTSDSEDDKTRHVLIELVISEGSRTKVKAISFSGLDAISRETALTVLTLQPGSFFDPSRVETDTAALHQAVSEAGFPHVKITAEESFTTDRTGVIIRYDVDQGPPVRVGQIFYAGNLRTRDSILADEMEITTGDPFSLSRLVDSRRNILEINALDSARLRTVGLRAEEEEVDLILEVSERKPYFVEAGTGYDTDRHLYFNARIGDRNFTGRNLDLQAGAEVSEIGYKADVSLTEPRFFSTRFLSHTRAFTEEREDFNKDFGIRTYGLSQDFLRTFRDKTVVTNLGFVYEFRDQYLTEFRELTDDKKDQFRTRHIGVISPGVIYKTTDSYVRPRKGIWASANVDFSKGIDTDLDDFVKLRMDARYYFPVSAPLTLAVRGRYGYIQPYGKNTQVPEDQLFFLGGTTTVRRFDENMLRFDDEGNSVGGREMILGSVEARYDLGRNLEASLFYDIGSVAQTQGRTDSESFRDSVGVGLRYQTPVGPIGFLYGWKLDPLPGESKDNFHFSMGYTF
ncbi:MAG: BamA/TamA family outer membrane protein [Desulfobacteraceae bacterium]|nr:BamA/TamA family outer membrane protein [Desulfobacteraceae bacterium]